MDKQFTITIIVESKERAINVTTRGKDYLVEPLDEELLSAVGKTDLIYENGKYYPTNNDTAFRDYYLEVLKQIRSHDLEGS